MSVTLDAATLRRFGVANVEQPAGSATAVDQRANGLCFSDTGDSLISSHRDGVISLFSGATGKREADYLVKETGCKLVTFTHSNHAVLHASTAPAACTISYHDLNANKFVRVFRGHTGTVTSISMHPSNDLFLSMSTDGAFKLWDLRQSTPAATGAIAMPTKQQSPPTGEAPYPIAAFDIGGQVFCIATPQRMVGMYDTTRLTGSTDWPRPTCQASPGPLFQFATFPKLLKHLPADSVLPPPYSLLTSFTSVEFSPDDKLLALGTNDRGVLLVDGLYPYKEYALLNSHPVDPAHPCSVSWSPDGRWCTVGAVDGHVYAYDVSGRPTLPGPPSAVFPWSMGGPWEPACVCIGLDNKEEDARKKAVDGATAFRKRTHDMMNETRANFASSKGIKASELGPPRSVPSQAVPFAASTEEQVSRHEGPVTAVRWHPTAAVLATAARTVAVWTPPGPQFPSVDL